MVTSMNNSLFDPHIFHCFSHSNLRFYCFPMHWYFHAQYIYTFFTVNIYFVRPRAHFLNWLYIFSIEYEIKRKYELYMDIFLSTACDVITQEKTNDFNRTQSTLASESIWIRIKYAIGCRLQIYYQLNFHFFAGPTPAIWIMIYGHVTIEKKGQGPCWYIFITVKNAENMSSN